MVEKQLLTPLPPQGENFFRARLNGRREQSHTDIPLQRERDQKRMSQGESSVHESQTTLSQSSDASVIMEHITSGYERHVSSAQRVPAGWK